MAIGILGTGSAYPDRKLTNRDLEKMVDTSDEWIRSRTGIAERRICDPDTATSDLCARAGGRALEDAGFGPTDIDLIVVSTFTPDTLCPSSACHVMKHLNIPDCPALDVNAACTGFLYGLAVARGMLTTGVASKALVMGGDVLSKYTDFEDRSTCILFGDAAGAVVLGEVEEGRGVLSEFLSADGRQGESLTVPGLGSRKPATHALLDAGHQYIKMNGNGVFKFAVRIMVDALNEAITRARVTADDLDWVIPHQANIRIIESAVQRMGIPKERFIINLERFGNTSAASIPLALDEAAREGKIKRGDLIGLVAFGGGLTWGATTLRF